MAARASPGPRRTEGPGPAARSGARSAWHPAPKSRRQCSSPGRAHRKQALTAAHPSPRARPNHGDLPRWWAQASSDCLSRHRPASSGRFCATKAGPLPGSGARASGPSPSPTPTVSERRPQGSGPGVLCRFPSAWPSTDCLLGSAPSLRGAPSFQPDRPPVRGLPWCRGPFLPHGSLSPWGAGPFPPPPLSFSPTWLHGYLFGSLRSAFSYLF